MPHMRPARIHTDARPRSAWVNPPWASRRPAESSHNAPAAYANYAATLRPPTTNTARTGPKAAHGARRALCTAAAAATTSGYTRSHRKRYATGGPSRPTPTPPALPYGSPYGQGPAGTTSPTTAPTNHAETTVDHHELRRITARQAAQAVHDGHLQARGEYGSAEPASRTDRPRGTVCIACDAVNPHRPYGCGPWCMEGREQ